MRIALSLSAAALLLAAPVAAAQTFVYNGGPGERPARGRVGGQFYYAQPVGEFADYIDRGWGGNLNATWMVGPSGVLGLRADGGVMIYGNERTRECLLYTNCRVQVDVTTSNNIAFLGGGPQLIVPAGAVRPYVSGMIGWTWLWTDSRIEGTDSQGGEFATTTNYSDNTFSWGGTAGVLIPVTRSRNPFALDIGARYLQNGSARYLRRGDIIDVPGGVPLLNVQQSEANLITYYVGLSVGF